MMKSKVFVLCFTILLIFAQVVFGQERGVAVVRVKDANGQTREVKLYEGSYALIIGESDYTNGWNTLSGVKTDVSEVRTALEKHGFQVKVVMNAKRDELMSAVNTFIDEYGYKPENRLLIYYAGHGHTAKTTDGRGLGYIVPVDAPLATDDLAFKRKAIPMDDITNYARKIESKHALFVFDSCFSGKLVSRGEIAITPLILDSVRGAVRQFITSGAANQTVPDESDFRKLFVRGLDGAADENPRDGFILGSELADYLKRELTKSSAGRQTPQYDKIPDVELNQGDFIFTLGVPVLQTNTVANQNPVNVKLKQSPTMDVVTAQSILDRAIQFRDGSMQGQVQAIESLLARGHEFSSADLSGISFRGANLSQGVFKKTKMHVADLTEADLRGADLTSSGLRFANLYKARLDGAILTQTYAPFLSALETNFEKADLSGANFLNSDLRGANFSNANLRGASFAFSDLRGAKFDGADLTGAYFVGAVLDNATFTSAKIESTDFTGAAADKYSFTEQQKKGACRNQVTARWWIRLVENINDRGKDIISEQFDLDTFDDHSLPLCTTPPDAAIEYKSQYAGGDEFGLNTSYVSKGDRRESFINRVKNHKVFLITNLTRSRLLKGDNAQRKNWDAFVRNAVKNVKPISKPYLNTDMTLVYLLSNKLVKPEQVDWAWFARIRHGLEKNVNQKFGGNISGHSMWGNLFPPDAPWEDMPADIGELYKTWTLARVGKLPKTFTIARRLNRVWEKDGEPLNVYMENQELMETADGYSLRGSSSNIPFDALKIEQNRVSSTPNAMFNTAFVWTEYFNNYFVNIPANVLQEKNLNIEIDVNFDTVDPIAQDGQVKGIIFFVSHGEVRILKNDNKVLWRGKMQAIEPTGWQLEKKKERETLELKEWERIKESINPVDFRLFLYAFPKGTYAETAKNKLKQLPVIEDGKENMTWLDGEWEGSADQNGQKWEIKLDARYNGFYFNYSSRSCAGQWILIEKNNAKLTFLEKMFWEGDRCVTNGKVVLERKSATEIAFQFYEPNATKVTATGILTKK